MNDLADVFDKDTSQDELSEDFKISNWAIQWKMQFNPDPKKKGKKFYPKTQKTQGPSFNHQ